MKYIKDHIPKRRGKRPGTINRKDSITIHSTANPRSTAKNERDYLMNPSNTRSASWHIAVDDKEAREAIPLNEVSYHSGTSQGNRSSIGLELCESGNRAKTLDNGAKITASLLHARGWGVDRLKRHYDWSRKNCPRILNYNNWQGWKEFKNMVQEKLDILNGGGSQLSEDRVRAIAQEEISRALRPSTTNGSLGMWANDYFVNLNARGVQVGERRFNDIVTRGDLFALMGRLTAPNVLPGVIKHAEKHSQEE